MPFFLLHPKELEVIRRQKNAIVVDLRECDEYQKHHYKNAINIPYSECENWLGRFQRGRHYILYCEFGNLSLLAVRKLAQRGIIAYTVVGGMNGIRQYFKD